MPSDKELDAFSIESLPANTTVEIPMQDNSGKTGTTILAVSQAEIAQPLVDCKRTIEGITDGPLMKFLGSVPTKEALEMDPNSVAEGMVIGGQRLVLQDRSTGRPIVIAGMVDRTQPASFKSGKGKNKKTGEI